jgi:hypothetical protein
MPTKIVAIVKHVHITTQVKYTGVADHLSCKVIADRDARQMVPTIPKRTVSRIRIADPVLSDIGLYERIPHAVIIVGEFDNSGTSNIGLAWTEVNRHVSRTFPVE